MFGAAGSSTLSIDDPRHPQHGACIAATVLLVPATVGSSSSSSVLLELIARARAPAALVLGAPDAILCLGAVVADAMGWPAPPVVELPVAEHRQLEPGSRVRLTADGQFQKTPLPV